MILPWVLVMLCGAIMFGLRSDAQTVRKRAANMAQHVAQQSAAMDTERARWDVQRLKLQRDIAAWRSYAKRCERAARKGGAK